MNDEQSIPFRVWHKRPTNTVARDRLLKIAAIALSYWVAFSLGIRLALFISDYRPTIPVVPVQPIIQQNPFGAREP